jgi:hypothetical protein
MRIRLLAALAALLLVALPAFAADRVVQNGIDPWYTPGNGKTFIDFQKNPIPAGFFCSKSKPFTGRVVFQGVPVATGEAKVLGNTDTIVQRLDDAVFNRSGVAVTRIQVRALHFESTQPIQTACGAFKVEVKLNGEQPITGMRIVRQDDNGGRFFAPIAVNGKLGFTPVGWRSNEILEIDRNVRFPANQGIVWASGTGLKQKIVHRAGFVLVDTDNDHVPDTYLPGTTTGFAAGAIGGVKSKVFVARSPYANCHLEYSDEAIAEGHCPEPGQIQN